MNEKTEAFLDAVLRRSPTQVVFRASASRRLAVLAYHGVDDPERFERQLDDLRRSARAVTLDEAIASFDGGRPLPPKAVLITFDDGHRSVLEVGLPLLRERGLPAVVFVIAGLVDTERPPWWTEVIDLAGRGGIVTGMPPLAPADLVRALKRVPDDRRRAAIEELRGTVGAPAAPVPQLSTADLRLLESEGVAVGNHTWSHPCLSRCDDETSTREIDASHRWLSEALGHHPTAFAYPDGDRDARAAARLRELDYRAAFLFDHRLSAPRPRDRFAVSRLRVNSTTSLDRFRTIRSGLHPAIHRARKGA